MDYGPDLFRKFKRIEKRIGKAQMAARTRTSGYRVSVASHSLK